MSRRVGRRADPEDEWKRLRECGFGVTLDWVRAFADHYASETANTTSIPFRQAVLGELVASDFRRLPVTSVYHRCASAIHILPYIPLDKYVPGATPAGSGGEQRQNRSGVIGEKLILQVLEARNVALPLDSSQQGRRRKRYKQDISGLSSFTDAMMGGGSSSSELTSSSKLAHAEDEEANMDDDPSGGSASIPATLAMTKKRVLKFVLTDGVSIFHAIEQEPLDGLMLTKPQTKRDMNNFRPPVIIGKDESGKPISAFATGGVWGDAVLTGGYKIVVHNCRVQDGCMLLTPNTARVLGGAIIRSTGGTSTQSLLPSPSLLPTSSPSSSTSSHALMSAECSSTSVSATAASPPVDAMTVAIATTITPAPSSPVRTGISSSPLATTSPAIYSKPDTSSTSGSLTSSQSGGPASPSRPLARGSLYLARSRRSLSGSGSSQTDSSSTNSVSGSNVSRASAASPMAPSIPQQAAADSVTSSIDLFDESKFPVSLFDTLQVPNDDHANEDKPKEGLFALAEIIIKFRLCALALDLLFQHGADSDQARLTWDKVAAIYRTKQKDLYMQFTADEQGRPLSTLSIEDLISRQAQLRAKFEDIARRTARVRLQLVSLTRVRDNQFQAIALAQESRRVGDAWEYAILPIQVASHVIERKLGVTADTYFEGLNKLDPQMLDKAQRLKADFEDFHDGISLNIANVEDAFDVGRLEPVISLSATDLIDPRWLKHHGFSQTSTYHHDADLIDERPMFFLCGPVQTDAPIKLTGTETLKAYAVKALGGKKLPIVTSLDW